uniref:Uncharacterized protein n=1 Tax=Arion vulgaris TaxID=1028688 RepID=A0A0B7BMS8_9EUPU
MISDTSVPDINLFFYHYTQTTVMSCLSHIIAEVRMVLESGSLTEVIERVQLN